MTLRHRLVRRWTRMLMPFRYEGERACVCWCGGRLSPSPWSPLVGECRDCGTGALFDRLTEIAYGRFYASGTYRRYTMGTGDVTAAQLAKEIRRAEAAFRFLSDQAFDVYGKSVMDVGSGAGGALIVARLLRAGIVLGVDSDPRSQPIPESFHIPVLTEMPPTDIPFDRIICSHLIEHVLRPVEFLRMLGGYLAPGGCLYVETPAWGPKAEVKLPHPYYFSEHSLGYLAQQAGLDAIVMKPSIRCILKRGN